MGKPTGFKEYPRELPKDRPVDERLHDFNEIHEELSVNNLRRQAARCMDCGVPFCHAGCPLGNLIPDWNDWVYRDAWEQAFVALSATNNFPEFTGRLCPAPCEEACCAGLATEPVTIEQIEQRIAEHAFRKGWVVPRPPAQRTGKKVAVVGSGPAGLACAAQLNRAGHLVTVFERAERPGGLLRYGIPDFKLEKTVIDRRLQVLAAEGIVFRNNAAVGGNVSAAGLQAFDAVVLCIGSTKSRDLAIPGRELEGIHYAMDFLPQQNRQVAGLAPRVTVSAQDRDVVVIGGGDTGSDCIGTARRQGARAVVNFELLPMPSLARPAHQPWPYWPMRLRSSTSHAEGAQRFFSILTKKFIGSGGRVQALQTVNVEFVKAASGRLTMQELPGTEYEWPAQLVLLALGFVGPERDNAVQALGVELDERGNIKTDANYRTNQPKIFAAGDAHRGQSLVVWAISEGREAARCVDLQLMGRTELPSKGAGDLPRI